MDKDQKMKVETVIYEFINGVLVSKTHETKNLDAKWSHIDPTCFTKENYGIGLMTPYYIETNSLQNKNDEYRKIRDFLNEYIDIYAQKTGVPSEDLKIEFMNYGKTELVYMLTDKQSNKLTFLVKQPATLYGDIKKEANYLVELQKKDPLVVAPVDYYANLEYELYVTPYIYQARCIASDEQWGIYIPEPYYRFEEFNDKQREIVNTCMIAKLVSLYDFENGEGIAKCKLGGGDFMLPKGWELETPTIENTLQKLYLIAAREKVKCSFEEYLEIIRKEFAKTTINENESDLTINIRGRVPMNEAEISQGINLGIKLIEQNGYKEGFSRKRCF